MFILQQCLVVSIFHLLFNFCNAFSGSQVFVIPFASNIPRLVLHPSLLVDVFLVLWTFLDERRGSKKQRAISVPPLGGVSWLDRTRFVRSLSVLSIRKKVIAPTQVSESG
jgi:hypothetical protein